MKTLCCTLLLACCVIHPASAKEKTTPLTTKNLTGIWQLDEDYFRSQRMADLAKGDPKKMSTEEITIQTEKDLKQMKGWANKGKDVVLEFRANGILRMMGKEADWEVKDGTLWSIDSEGPGDGREKIKAHLKDGYLHLEDFPKLFRFKKSAVPK